LLTTTPLSSPATVAPGNGGTGTEEASVDVRPARVDGGGATHPLLSVMEAVTGQSVTVWDSAGSEDEGASAFKIVARDSATNVPVKRGG
jgi:hypothetical protein